MKFSSTAIKMIFWILIFWICGICMVFSGAMLGYYLAVDEVWGVMWISFLLGYLYCQLVTLLKVEGG